MDQLYAAMDAAWRVLVVGVLLGAGLPALFALGVRSLAWGAGGEAAVHPAGVTVRPRLIGRLGAYALFTAVILSVLMGIGYIVAHGFGMVITFNGIWPVFTPKG